MDIPLHKYNKFLEILNYHSQKRQNDSNEDLKEKLEFLPDFQSLREIIKTRIKEIDNEIQFSEMKHLLLMSILILSVPMKANNYISMRSVFDGEVTKDNLNLFIVYNNEFSINNIKFK